MVCNLLADIYFAEVSSVSDYVNKMIFPLNITTIKIHLLAILFVNSQLSQLIEF